MAEGPTTVNGPLHTPEATVDDRLISATFASTADADAVRERLVQAGIAPDRVAVGGNVGAARGTGAAERPADRGLIATVREMLSPEDSNTAFRDAARNDDAILELRPLPGEVEMAVQLIQAGNPTHFDAELERWRNKG